MMYAARYRPRYRSRYFRHTEGGKKELREQIRLKIKSPDSYAGKYMKDVEEIDTVVLKLKADAETYAREFISRVRAREKRLWGEAITQASVT